MPTLICYITVVIIWSTTPLAIKFSTGSFSFIAAVTSRMVISAFFAYVICRFSGIKLSSDKTAIKAYFSGAIGTFGGLLCVYWGAQYVPTGLISIMFGLTPIISAILALIVLKESFVTPVKLLAIFIAVSGLATVFYTDSFSGSVAIGAAVVLAAVMLFNLSTVFVKLNGSQLHPLEQTTGTLIVTSILYVAVWSITDGVIPEEMDNINLLAIAYLAICGSVIGFIAYYNVLKKMNVVSVGMITLMTPIFAMLLGVYLNNEHVLLHQWVGLAIVILGLSLFVLSRGAVEKTVD